MKLKKITFDAVLVNRLLIGGIALMVVITGVGFYFASTFLAATALETDHAKTNAELSERDVSQLQRLQSELEGKKEVVERAAQIVSDSKEYQYQDQIVRDIGAFADKAGVEVLGYGFETTPAPNATKPTIVIPGVKTINATVNLKSPQRYTNFLKFLKAIEQNLTKMQVSGINLSPDSNNPNLINNPSVGLIIYVKG